MTVSSDDWAWARQEAEDAPPVTGFEHVTAILVAHNGQEWLPTTLEALANLDQPPGFVVAVDAASSDNSGRLLRQALDEGVIVQGVGRRRVLHSVQAAKSDGFTQAVNTVVSTLPETGDWLWLLHDDSAPSPNCLTEILRVANTPEKPAMVVPKLLRPKLRHRPDQVQAVGEAVSASGARVTGPELAEVNQQSEESSRALGASTAGLLIRREVWDALGGLSNELPGFRAGVDLGWRANEAGLTVRTAPDATLRHQQAGLIGLRDSEQANAPEVQDLVAGLRVVVAHSGSPGRAVWRARLMNRLVWLGAWVAKDANQAHVRAAAIKLFQTERAETKQLAADVHKESRSSVRKSLTPGLMWGISHAFDVVSGRFGHGDEESDINLDALTAADDDTVVLPHPAGKHWLGIGAAALLLIATVVAARSLLGFGALMSTGLAPAPSSLADAWRAWLVPSAPAGANAPWLGLMALGSTIMGGQPGLWADVMVIGGVFLAAWSAFRFVRFFIGSVPACAGLALLWGLLLPVTGASADGSPGWVILAVTLPWLATSMVRWSNDPIQGLVGLRRPATAALAVTLMCTVTPVLWVASAVGSLFVALRNRDWRGMVIIVAAPLVVLGPWLVRLANQPGRFFTGVDPGLSRLIAAPDPLGILVGRLGLSGTAPIWVSLVFFSAVWLLGLIGIAFLPASRWRLWLLIGMVASVVAGLVLSRVTVTIDDQVVRAAVLPWLMVAVVIAVGAAAATWPKAPVKPVPVDDSNDEPAPLPPLGGHGHRTIVAAFIIIGAVFGLFWWLWAAQGQPLHRDSLAVPDYVAASEQSTRATRTLVVQVADNQASVSLHDAHTPTWGSGERSPINLDEADRQAVVALAGQFADGFATDDLAPRLTALGIGHVVVTGVSSTNIDAMSGVPDLASGTVGDTTVWTVGGTPSRELLSDGDTVSPVTDGTVADGQAGRQLILIEPSNMPWWATANGVRLEATETATHFTLPAAGGVIKWGLPLLWWALWWHLLSWLLLVWAAMPASSVAERLARAGARRAVE